MPELMDRTFTPVTTSRSMESSTATRDGGSAPEYKFDGYETVSQEKVALTPISQQANKTVVRTVGGTAHG